MMIKAGASKLTVLIALGAVVLSPLTLQAQDPAKVFDPVEKQTLNFYGLPGIVDMPSAEALPDGQLAVGVSHFGGISRTTLTFQATPRLTASFRYSGIRDWNANGFSTYRDRSFDVRFLLNRESRHLPALAIGLQDFAGTGINSGEYIVATKNFSHGRIPGNVKLTAGLGWGRLGSSGAIGSPFGANRPTFRPGDTGGKLSAGQWFRGDMAPFAGIEWQVNDKLGLKAEYSSDAYLPETGNGVFERKSKLNFGAEYQVSERVRLGAYYLYGSQFGVNVQMLLHPNRPVSPMRIAAPRPYDIRPSRSANPSAYSGDWAVSQEAASGAVRDALVPLLKAEGLTLISAHSSATTAEVRFVNDSYPALSVAVGRVARVMARALPASVETFRIVPVQGDLPQAAVVMKRRDLERLEISPDATSALLAQTKFEGASGYLPGTAINENVFPKFTWSLGPYLAPSYFDPDEPVRVDAGVNLGFSYRPAQGWVVAGNLRHRLIGNVGDSARTSNSVLPHVRTDAVLYAREGKTALTNLYVARQWKPNENLHARVTAGYLEKMYGGVSAELLWKPVTSRLALGVEANYVKKRDFDQLLGFQDYSVATGHASAYYEFGDGYLGQVDVGRYLAGDVGATFTLSREFANGWKVGGFFTVTDVSAEEFGEGSFDKGITVEVPVSWFLGKPSKRKLGTTIRPVQRDGGARLEVPGRLYEQVRGGHQRALSRSWSGVWE